MQPSSPKGGLEKGVPPFLLIIRKTKRKHSWNYPSWRVIMLSLLLLSLKANSQICWMSKFTFRLGSQTEIFVLLCLISGYQHCEDLGSFSTKHMPRLIRYKQLQRTTPNWNAISINETETINCEGIKTVHWLGTTAPNADRECHFSETVSRTAKVSVTHLLEVWRLNEVVRSKMPSTATSISWAFYTIENDRDHNLDQQQDAELFTLHSTGWRSPDINVGTATKLLKRVRFLKLRFASRVGFASTYALGSQNCI